MAHETFHRILAKFAAKMWTAIAALWAMMRYPLPNLSAIGGSHYVLCVIIVLLTATVSTTRAGILDEGVYVTDGHEPFKIIAAELNGQPGIDLATASDTTGTVSVLPNLGNGTFGTPIVTSVEPGASLFTLCAADFDGDLNNDLVVGRDTTVSILVNDGSGQFTLGQTLPTNGQVAMREICAGDVDGDGDVDVLWGNPTLGGGLWLAENEGGTFDTPVELYHSKVDDPVLIHIDNDDHLDIAFHRGWTKEIVVLLGLGDGTFQSPVTYTVQTSGASYDIQDLAAGDLDGDGDLDLTYSTNLVVHVYQLTNFGGGTFGENAEIAWDGVAPAYSLIAPDLYGLGCASVVPVCENTAHFVFPNDCTGIDYNNPEILTPSAAARDVTAADLDGDTDPDLAYAITFESKVLVHFNNRLDLYDAVIVLKLLAGLPLGQAVYDGVDVDGDGVIGMAEAVFALQTAAGIR